jgi:cell division protein FtsQ
MTIMLPEDHEVAALQRLHELQSSDSLLDRPLVFVDLRLKDRLAVRPRPNVQAAPQAMPEARPPEAANRRAT